MDFGNLILQLAALTLHVKFFLIGQLHGSVLTWHNRSRSTKMFSIKLLFCALILCFSVSANSQTVHRRFEYKYSFKPPYLAQKDGSVPFWEYGGSEYSDFSAYFCYLKQILCCKSRHNLLPEGYCLCSFSILCYKNVLMKYF